MNDIFFIHLKIQNLGLHDEPKSLRTQYQLQNETQIRKNQKVIRSNNDEIVVKNYPEK